MGPDLEIKGRLGSMESLDGKENEKSLGEPVAMNMTCVSNYQDDIFELEDSVHKQAEQVNQVEKSEVKIMESTHQSENTLNETASQDETENSSSFGNTLSGDENDETLSDSEVMSKLRDNGFNQECRMRKKSLTSHWKTFRQPCMWRCKWAELRMRILLYQASKYDLQAEAISRRKHLTFKNTTIEDTGAKSLPVSGSTQRNTVMERRKRKRVEDPIDTAAYMAQHPLFSYPGCKNYGADVAASMNDLAKIGNSTDNRIKGDFVFGCGNEPVSLEFRNDDNSLEQILWKIGVLQSHLSDIKTRAKKVSSVASQLMPKCDRCDMLMTGSAISTHGEVANLIDMFECNDQLPIGILCEKEGDGHLMHNSTAKELNDIEKVKIQPTEKSETPKQREQANIVSSVLEPVISISDDQPKTLKEERANMVPSVPVPVLSISDNQHETPKEELANMIPSVPVPVSSITDDQPETPKEEQANMIPSVPVPVISIEDDQPTPKKRSISGLTSPHNARSRGRRRGRRRCPRWSRRA